jgi:hypothetical protein
MQMTKLQLCFKNGKEFFLDLPAGEATEALQTINEAKQAGKKMVLLEASNSITLIDPNEVQFIYVH